MNIGLAGIAQKSSVAAFPLWSLQKQNSWVKRCDKNMKAVVGFLLLPTGVFIYNEELEINQGR